MTHRLTLCGILFSAMLTMGLNGAHAATPNHFYDLNNSLVDIFGGPSLVAHGGTVLATGYTFGANQGLSLSNALPSGNYTIDISFLLDDTPGYRKIIDFKDLASDSGTYNLSSALNFYPVDTSNSLAIPQDTTVRVTLSRDGSTGTVTGYVNGDLQFSFVDNAGLATFDTPQQVAHFFIDDFATGQGEASGGHVNYIAVYNRALSASEVASLPSAVPEPGGWLLALGGVGMVGWRLRRRS